MGMVKIRISIGIGKWPTFIGGMESNSDNRAFKFTLIIQPIDVSEDSGILLTTPRKICSS